MPNGQTIVGIAGRRGAGKDTSADALIADGAHNVKFAGALKAMLTAYLTYIRVHPTIINRMIEGDLKEVPTELLCGKTPRFAMQTLGTDWGRLMMGETFWLDAFDRHISPATRGMRSIVVTDMRYQNEVEHLKGLGGVTIRVEDPNRVERDGDEHSSEALVDQLEVDHVIINNKETTTVPQLHAMVRNAVEKK